MKFKQVIARAGLGLGGLIVIGYAGLYLFQDKIIFQSTPLEKEYKFEFDAPFREFFVAVPNTDGPPDSLNVVLFPADSMSRGLIIYLHGNRGNLQRWGNIASKLTQFGYDVLVYDYRGYGKSTGRPSEETLYNDASVLFRWATYQGKRPATIYGRSLGSAVASHLAIETKPDVLILETPFDEIRGAIPPYWSPLTSLLPLKYTFSNSENLRLVHSRVIIFHGTNDRIVPLKSALRLKEWTAPNDFVILENGTHRNLTSFPAYREKLTEVLTRPNF